MFNGLLTDTQELNVLLKRVQDIHDLLQENSHGKLCECPMCEAEGLTEELYNDVYDAHERMKRAANRRPHIERRVWGVVTRDAVPIGLFNTEAQANAELRKWRKPDAYVRDYTVNGFDD